MVATPLCFLHQTLLRNYRGVPLKGGAKEVAYNKFAIFNQYLAIFRTLGVIGIEYGRRNTWEPGWPSARQPFPAKPDVKIRRKREK